MTLEPTEEQLARIREVGFCDEDFRPTSESVREVFAVIRDIVLEAAARLCDERARDSDVAERCAINIRAMKGMP